MLMMHTIDDHQPQSRADVASPDERAKTLKDNANCRIPIDATMNDEDAIQNTESTMI